MSLFPSRLKMLRNERDLTQGELSKKLNIPRSSIAGYETSGKEPSFDALCEIAAFFDVSVDYLIGASSERKNGSAIFPGDSIHFKLHYEHLPDSLRPFLLRCFSAMYDTLNSDVRDCRPERLPLYADLFEAIAKYRKQITRKAGEVSTGSDPMAVSDTMFLQDEFKSAVGTILSQLLQADMQVEQNKRDVVEGGLPEETAG